MNAAGVFKAIQQATERYRRQLEHIPEGRFQQSPASGGWSYSEVYTHIFELSMLSLNAIDACASPGAKPRDTPFITRAILFFGTFPPAMKFKVPERFAASARKINKSSAVTMINEFESKLTPYLSSVNQSDPNMKSPHPRLGYLNATQWLRFTEIHLKHHLKQLKRIDKRF